jgi:hypothetical protein
MSNPLGKEELNNMNLVQKKPTHRQRLHHRQHPVALYAVEKARLRARRWKQWPTVEIGAQP